MIKNVTVKPGCISCGTCENICPKVFKVEGTSQVIGDDFKAEKSRILEAEKSCPVQVISVKQEGITKDQKTTASSVATFLRAVPKTENVYEFQFHYPQFQFTAGQFVSMEMQDEAGLFYRCYSVKAYENNILKLCIKVLPDGRGGRFLKTLKPQQTYKLSQGTGQFQLQENTNPKIFVGTGTGIAPLMAMLSSDPLSPKKLLLGFRAESDQLYIEDLPQFENTEIYTALSRPSAHWKGLKGRVTDILPTWDIQAPTEIYICGNPMMVESVLDYFKSQKYSESLIFYERFTSPEPAKKTPLVAAPATLTKPRRNPVAWLQRFWLIAASLVPFAYFFPSVQGWLWDLSLYTVAALMLIRPLGDVLPRFKGLRRLIPLRKELGIFSASVVVAYGAFHYLSPNFDFFNTYFSVHYWRFENYLFFAHLGELTGLILLLTSNTWSQKHLKKNWKRVQRLAYVYFFSGSIYVFAAFDKTIALYAMVAVAVLWTLAFFKIKLWK